MNADGTLDLAAPAIERAEREVRLDGVRVRIHELQEHVERAIGLLGDEVIEPGEIVRMKFAERPRVQRLPQPKWPARMPITSAARIRSQCSQERSGMGRAACQPALEGTGSVANRLIRAVVDALAQILSRLEVRHVLSGERDGLAGLGIAPLTRRAKVQREAAESADFDALPGRQARRS